MFLAWAVLAVLIVSSCGPSAAPAPTPRALVEPDEPCRVEASTPAARAAAQNWCGDGIFTLVNVTSDGTNFVAMMQFSKKGQRSWAKTKLATLNQFRRLTDAMVEKADTNVAISVFDTDGKLVGGCARSRSASESKCESK